LKILIADFLKLSSDEASEGCISLIEKEYVNPHRQKQEIPCDIKPADRLGAGSRGNEGVRLSGVGPN